MIIRRRTGVLQNSTLLSLAPSRRGRRPRSELKRRVRSIAVNTAVPTITGTVRRGATLTAHPGSWKVLGSAVYAYQWQRCDSGGGSCVDILNADESQYIIQSSDVGGTIRVVVTVSDV